MKYTIALIFAAVSAVAQEIAPVFNITNYPAVASVKAAFDTFEVNVDGYNRSRMFWASQTEETKNAYLDGLVQIARDWNGENVSLFNPDIVFPNFFDPEKIEEIDQQLFENGVKCPLHVWWWNTKYNNVLTYYTFPKVFNAWYDDTNTTQTAKSRFRVLITICHRYESASDIPFEARININADSINKNFVTGSSDNIKDGLLSELPFFIKKKLREQGKTFFADDETGINPVQEAVDEFIETLQAPRLAGLKEWVAKWSPDYEWVDVNPWPTDEKIEDIKDKVYYGRYDFDQYKTMLMNNLGVEAFNAFVKHYNGED